MHMKRLVFLKLGGSLITDKAKPMQAQTDVIRMLTQQIAAALQEDPDLQLVIGNGAGSFAHYAVIHNDMEQGLTGPDKRMGYAKVQQAATQLNRIIVDALLEAGVPAMTLQPSSFLTASNGTIQQFPTHVLLAALDASITPVMYGDILFDSQKGSIIASTEMLIAAAAKAFVQQGTSVHKVIHNGVTQGVLDQNNKVIPSINRKNFPAIKKFLYATNGFDVTGGILHKIEESLDLSEKGIQSVIINGASEKDLLKRALLDEHVTGTYFL